MAGDFILRVVTDCLTLSIRLELNLFLSRILAIDREETVYTNAYLCVIKPAPERSSQIASPDTDLQHSRRPRLPSP
jgi:hypothetical protein